MSSVACRIVHDCSQHACLLQPPAQPPLLGTQRGPSRAESEPLLYPAIPPESKAIEHVTWQSPQNLLFQLTIIVGAKLSSEEEGQEREDEVGIPYSLLSPKSINEK
ncbi:Calpain-11 [Manis pentadactyla]|nr:Calpain-11 [Manis pentadactyla]